MGSFRKGPPCRAPQVGSIKTGNCQRTKCSGSLCAANFANAHVRVGSKSPPADDVVYTAEDPQKADRIAAAPRTGGQCRFCCKSRRRGCRGPCCECRCGRCCRSLQLERRPDALVPTPATQLQRYLTLTQHTRRQRAGGRAASLARRRRFWAIAANVNSNWAPRGPRNLRRPSRRMRFR